MENKLYVLVDSQYDASYRAVQSGHAVAEYLLKDNLKKWNNQTLIFLQTPEIEKEFNILKFNNLNPIPFFEVDVGNKMTAFAVCCKKLKKDFKLN